jgi:hypothetical protein
MDQKGGNNLISRISSKERIPFNKEGPRIMDRAMAMATVEAMDGTINKFASS